MTSPPFRLSKKVRDHKRRNICRERQPVVPSRFFSQNLISKRRIVFTKVLETSSFKDFFACFSRSVTSRCINIHLRVPFGKSHTFLDSLPPCRKFFDTLNGGDVFDITSIIYLGRMISPFSLM